MTNAEGKSAYDKRIELTVKVGVFRSPVDPVRQLDLATLSRLLQERLRQIKAQPELGLAELCMDSLSHLGREVSTFHMINSLGPALAGMPAYEEALWEYICPNCGDRTVHSVQVYAGEKYHGWDFGTRCIGQRHENICKMLSTIVSLDLELIPVGFCAHCDLDVRVPTVRLVARFPDAPERELDFKEADGGLACLKHLSHSGCTLNNSDCRALAKWLGIDLNSTDKP